MSTQSGPETPSDLLRALEQMTSETERKRTSWPDTAARLGRHLARIAPALRNVGVEVARERIGGNERTRIIGLRMADGRGTAPGQ